MMDPQPIMLQQNHHDGIDHHHPEQVAAAAAAAAVAPIISRRQFTLSVKPYPMSTSPHPGQVFEANEHIFLIVKCLDGRTLEIHAPHPTMLNPCERKARRQQQRQDGNDSDDHDDEGWINLRVAFDPSKHRHIECRWYSLCYRDGDQPKKNEVHEAEDWI